MRERDADQADVGARIRVRHDRGAAEEDEGERSDQLDGEAATQRGHA
jgi:hypothetical protein